jgi:DNA repair protein RecN (Recombination protein N)
MLRELHISNLAVIEDVTLELGEGLNCFTGQTGAGKSLILGAFEILLGLKSGNAADMLRPGAEEGRISGLFELARPEIAQQVAQIADMPADDGASLLITRKLFASGRSSTAINGRPATASMVRDIGRLLVDIHGQHDHQYLLLPSNQLRILDAFGRCTPLRREYAAAHGNLSELNERRQRLSASTTLRRQQLDLYEFQAGEIDDAELVEGEFQELKARHDLLSNLKDVQAKAGQAYAALYDADGSIVERLQMVVHVLEDLAEIDEQLSETCEQIRTAALSLQEAAFDLGRYNDRLDLDPGELAEIDDRLSTIHRLSSKYANPRCEDPIAELLAYREQIGREIQRLRGDTQDLTRIDSDIDDAQKLLAKLGKQLAKARRDAAAKLKPLVEAELKPLGMADAEMEVAFEPEEDSPAGPDAIEFMVRTNPGQPARPLRKIASGGEISRIMLAMKTILADSDRISVLVFDEIDANIGGRMGTIIGQKLRRLAGQANHQVLCITHLPQIAAFGNRHLRVAKEVEGKGKDRRTRTTVTQLSDKDRVNELAEMLAGKEASATTRKQARELLQTAAG